MKQFAVLILIAIFINPRARAEDSQHIWTVSEGLKNPESVAFDYHSSTYFVSNINGDGATKDGNGFISRLSGHGDVIKLLWAVGLNAPKGLALQGSSLWVADIDELVEIDVATGAVKRKITIGGAKFLNDVAANQEFVFVSDTLGNQIYKFDGTEVKKLSTVENFDSPNGLFIDEDKLVVASWGEVSDFSQTPKSLGRIYSLSFSGEQKTFISAGLGNLDGLAKSSSGDYVVSDWVSGKIYKVKATGEAAVVYSGSQGTADLTVVETRGRSLIAVPLMLESKIVATPL